MGVTYVYPVGVAGSHIGCREGRLLNEIVCKERKKNSNVKQRVRRHRRYFRVVQCQWVAADRRSDDDEGEGQVLDGEGMDMESWWACCKRSTARKGERRRCWRRTVEHGFVDM
jgi:hypothetical protein